MFRRRGLKGRGGGEIPRLEEDFVHTFAVFGLAGVFGGWRCHLVLWRWMEDECVGFGLIVIGFWFVRSVGEKVMVRSKTKYG